jgi:hypothetical protein
MAAGRQDLGIGHTGALDAKGSSSGVQAIQPRPLTPWLARAQDRC